MDSKVLKLINNARTSPTSFFELLSSIKFTSDAAEIDSQTWQTNHSQSSITAIEPYLSTPMQAFQFSRFTNSPKALVISESHPLLMTLSVLLSLHTELLDKESDEICINIDKAVNDFIVKISVRKSLYKTMVSTQSLKQFQDKPRKVADEVLRNPQLKKKFKQLFLKGNEWINELARIYGPFTGYELNEFILWFKTGEKSAFKQKNIPKAYEPRSRVLPEKIINNEGGIEPEGTVVVKKTNEDVEKLHPVEAGINAFCGKSEGNAKFTFKAKQRFIDMKEVIIKNNGFVDDSTVKSLPEKDCEEIAKEPPISVPEKYEALLIEEVLIPPPAVQVAPVQKPGFNTKFRLPDNLKIKQETAKLMLDNKIDPLSDPYIHKFRDDFDPKSSGKTDFVLRLPKPKQEIAISMSEPLEKTKQQRKEEKWKMEEEEKKRRTQLYGKIRGEWVFGFKPVSSFYEMGSGKPHKLLPKDDFIEITKVLSRAS